VVSIRIAQQGGVLVQALEPIDQHLGCEERNLFIDLTVDDEYRCGSLGVPRVVGGEQV